MRQRPFDDRFCLREFDLGQTVPPPFDRLGGEGLTRSSQHEAR